MNLFDKVKCNGFYSKVRDGTYICLDSQNLKAAHMNSNAVDTECLVEEDVDRVEKNVLQTRKTELLRSYRRI